ncbi:MAG: hypothetical protein KDA21_01795, partial [Phycisphaerales bacterium]|nr:hypothetical protein [Phycisphaerales bacterium]
QQQGTRETAGENAEDQGGAGRPLSRVRDQIERMKEQQQRGDQRRADAAEMRRKAEEVLEGMSESERREFEQWARAMQREQGQDAAPDAARRPAQSELVDARNPDAAQPRGDEQPIAEWYDPDADYRHDPVISEGEQLAAPIEDALRSAERAMEDNVIPRRFRNVQRYFELAKAAAARREATPTAPTPLAPEVNPD